jgi:hypothetical protein
MIKKNELPRHKLLLCENSKKIKCIHCLRLIDREKNLGFLFYVITYCIFCLCENTKVGMQSLLPTTLPEFEKHLSMLKIVDVSQSGFFINPDASHVKLSQNINKPLILQLEETFLSKYAVCLYFPFVVFVLDVEEELGHFLVVRTSNENTVRFVCKEATEYDFLVHFRYYLLGK